jgi:muconolactone delta-isomerase
MRYLLQWVLLPVPPEMAKTALSLLKASQAYTSGLAKKGVITEMWNLTDGTGGLAIIEADSNDALFKLLSEEPYGPFLQFSVTPLTDINLAYETAEQQFKQMIGE